MILVHQLSKWPKMIFYSLFFPYNFHLKNACVLTYWFDIMFISIHVMFLMCQNWMNKHKNWNYCRYFENGRAKLAKTSTKSKLNSLPIIKCFPFLHERLTPCFCTKMKDVVPFKRVMIFKFTIVKKKKHSIYKPCQV